MTGIVTNEDSFYIRTTLYQPSPAPLLELFETPSRWLTADWLDAQHILVDATEIGNSQQLRCVWRDGVSVVIFDLLQMQAGAFRIDASLDPAPARRDVGAISNACSIAKQNFVRELAKDQA